MIYTLAIVKVQLANKERTIEGNKNEAVFYLSTVKNHVLIKNTKKMNN
jgi:hypothetical protein